MGHIWSKNADQMLPSNFFIDVCDIPLRDPRAAHPVAHIDEKIETGCPPLSGHISSRYCQYVPKWQKIIHIMSLTYGLYTPDIPTMLAYY